VGRSSAGTLFFAEVEQVAFDFANVLVFGLVSIIFVFAMVGVGRLVRPRFPSKAKSEIYECGEKPIGTAWFNFNPRFYIVALVFVIFEVEIALMLPVVLVFKRYVAQGAGGLAFVEIFAFLFILAVGLAWVWAKGDLDWIKKLVTPAGRTKG
jgi:NADH-quinone oxidoreductase subunit A